MFAIFNTQNYEFIQEEEVFDEQALIIIVLNISANFSSITKSEII